MALPPCLLHGLESPCLSAGPAPCGGVCQIVPPSQTDCLLSFPPCASRFRYGGLSYLTCERLTLCPIQKKMIAKELLSQVGAWHLGVAGAWHVRMRGRNGCALPQRLNGRCHVHSTAGLLFSDARVPLSLPRCCGPLCCSSRTSAGWTPDATHHACLQSLPLPPVLPQKEIDWVDAYHKQVRHCAVHALCCVRWVLWIMWCCAVVWPLPWPNHHQSCADPHNGLAASAVASAAHCCRCGARCPHSRLPLLPSQNNALSMAWLPVPIRAGVGRAVPAAGGRGGGAGLAAGGHRAALNNQLSNRQPLPRRQGGTGPRSWPAAGERLCRRRRRKDSVQLRHYGTAPATLWKQCRCTLHPSIPSSFCCSAFCCTWSVN